MSVFINKKSEIKYCGNSFGYHEIITNVSRIAENIQSIKDIENQRVAIYLDRAPSMIFAILAVLELGYTYIPLDTQMPQNRMEYILNDCNVDVVITNSRHKGKFGRRKTICVENIENTNDILPQCKIQPEHSAYIIYTSGTTGNPKGVEITYDSFMNFLETFPQEIHLSSQRIVPCFTNVSFDMFLLESILPIYRGMKVVLANSEEQKNPSLMKNLIVNNNIDLLMITPSRMTILEQYDRSFYCLKNVMDIMIGAEPLPLNLLRNLQKHTTANIFNMYGPTEATVWATMSNLTNSKVIDIGMPIANANVYIVDESMNPVDNGVFGELCISGKGLAIGYLNNKELTADKFIYPDFLLGDRMYRTGDYGRYNENGKLECLGRIDNQIKLNGYRIELEEIESVINTFEGIVRSLVFFQDNTLRAYYKSLQSVDIQKMRNYLEKKLPSYMIPLHFIQVDDFEYTVNGKIDRKKSYDHRFNSLDGSSNDQTILQHGADSEVPETIEQIVMNIIQDNVKVPKKIFYDDPINVIGIDSLTFIKIVVDLEERFQFEFEDEKLLLDAFPYVSSFISYVDSKATRF